MRLTPASGQEEEEEEEEEEEGSLNNISSPLTIWNTRHICEHIWFPIFKLQSILIATKCKTYTRPSPDLCAILHLDVDYYFGVGH